MVILAWALFVLPAFAHDPSKSYLSLTLESNQLTGQWDIPLRDLQSVLPLDPDKDGYVAWEKLNARFQDITTYAFNHLKISVDDQRSVLHLMSTEPTVEEFNDGAYVQLAFTVEPTNGSRGQVVRAPVATDASAWNPPPKQLEITYELFFETNSLHRGLLRLEVEGKTQSAVFSPEHQTQKFSFKVSQPGHQFFAFVREGIWHIWTGYDHILFLVALLLPSVLERDAGKWRGVAALKPAFFNVLKIVTAFTVAHSLTLTLATLEIVKLPSRLTESAIAASVILAALNNLRPVVRERGWMVAFGFGLIHGFGFATALSDLGLAQGTLALTLVGFNLGVELGQLAIVGIFLPVAFSLRRTSVYQKPILNLGSAAIILISAAWLVERALDVKFMPF